MSDGKYDWYLKPKPSMVPCKDGAWLRIGNVYIYEKVHGIDKRRCRARVSGEWRGHQCTRQGKHELSGFLFCAQHQPEKAWEREQARKLENVRKWRQRDAASNCRTLRELIAVAAIDAVHQRVGFDAVASAVDAYEAAERELAS